ncbi:Gfo/Idh/MocA family protein [Cellulomonas triticagri]|uniref:Gfo/Idh/MocA family oxidoreductase n=1 Tax=Cellulomonas triticagri TaxID=2483352 RepID=A0A3M2JCL7_9CELL|nr:Gfo/Idh/MocA family oxidoreductase [Cellulomonas triticagri]RMI08705.1 gfo/Idh/MocA family oxidoreductase [Cellulomonas triticagri]
MTTTRWAVLGTGQIAGVFTDALAATADAEVVAVASTDPARARAFTAGRGIPVAGTYDEVLAADVDAVYVATVHTTHADLAVRALRAGLPVLCEKPLAPDAAQVDAVLAAAAEARLPVVEAYKYRFTPFADALRSVITSGRIGAVRSLRAEFGFTSLSRTGRLFDPALAGGAVYDVGGYPVSLAVAVARWAGVPPETLSVGRVEGRLSRRGVDERTRAVLAAPGVDGPGFEAHVAAAITRTLTRAVTVEGEHGTVHAADGWGTRGVSATGFEIRTAAGVERVEVPVVNAFAAEAAALVAAASAGVTEVEGMPWGDTTATARLLDAWRGALAP